MPNYDGTGPEGKGPMTGLCRGYCVVPIKDTEQEIEILMRQKNILQAQLKQINNRIKKVKTKKEVYHARI